MLLTNVPSLEPTTVFLELEITYVITYEYFLSLVFNMWALLPALPSGAWIMAFLLSETKTNRTKADFEFS